MNVTHLLTRQATERPDCVAIVDGVGSRARRVTFAQLALQSAAAATMLRRDGVGPGDRVLILVPMSLDLYVALIAVFRLGAVATFLDLSAGLSHVTHCCRIAEPAALIGSFKAHLLRLVSPALRRIRRRYAIGWPVPGATRWSTASGCVDQAGVTDVSDHHPALLTFTSGSTGQPKAAVRSHGFLAAQHHALAQAIELHAGEVDLATLPIFALANLASGVTTLIPKADLRRPGYVKAAPILRQARDELANRATASPAFFERLLDAAGTGDPGGALAGFTRVYTGGAPVFPGLLERLQRAMPSARVVAVYGSTEAEPIAHVAWDEISAEDSAAMFDGAGLLAGLPVPQVRLRVLPNTWGTPIEPMTDAAFESRALPGGQAGEIVVQGDHVLRGYLHGIGDEQTKFRVGNVIWHRTGDAGYIDARGRLWLLGRAEARIADERGTIYPFAVECAASRIDGISRTALVQHHGRRVLVVQSRDSHHPMDVARVASLLAWAALDEVLPVRHIPVDKRHNAKIDYPELRKLLARLISDARG